MTARTRRTLPGIGLLVLLAPLVATRATAEIYRWRDASGREHFTTDLQQVPPEQRDRAASGAGRGSLNFHTGDRSGDTRRDAPRKPARPAAASEPSGSGCRRLRAQARGLAKKIERKQRSVASWEGSAGDIGRSATSRRRAELRLEKAEAELAALRAELESLRTTARRQGHPPGCLR